MKQKIEGLTPSRQPQRKADVSRQTAAEIYLMRVRLTRPRSQRAPDERTDLAQHVPTVDALCRPWRAACSGTSCPVIHALASRRSG